MLTENDRNVHGIWLTTDCECCTSSWCIS